MTRKGHVTGLVVFDIHGRQSLGYVSMTAEMSEHLFLLIYTEMSLQIK